MIVCKGRPHTHNEILNVRLDNDKEGLYKVIFKPCVDNVLQETQIKPHVIKSNILEVYESCEKEQKLNCILCRAFDRCHTN